MPKKRTTPKQTLVRWDPVDSLKSKADVAAYLDAALADGDGALLAAALGDIAKAHGILKLAEETGISRQGLYKALRRNGNASFDTMLKVTRALGYTIRFEAQTAR